MLLLSLLACFPEKPVDVDTVRTADSGTDEGGQPEDTGEPDDSAEETGAEETGIGETGAEDSGGEDSGGEDSAPPPSDLDGDGHDAPADCDDTDADVFPGAGEGHFDADRGRDDDCDGEVDELPTVELTTDKWRVWVYLADTQPGDWWFGMAETGVGAAGWYGEDCIDDPADDWDYDYELCHPFTGTDLTLGNVDSIGELVEGETTLFYDALLADVTFYLATDDEALCWVWGDDPDWYVTEGHGGAGPLGCDVP